MEIGLIEIGLKQLLAGKNYNYVDQIDKITCSNVKNIEHKSSTTKKTQKLIKTWYKLQIGNVELESSTKVT